MNKITKAQADELTARQTPEFSFEPLKAFRDNQMMGHKPYCQITVVTATGGEIEGADEVRIRIYGMKEENVTPVAHLIAQAPEMQAKIAQLRQDKVELVAVLDKLLTETASAMGRVSDETFGEAEATIAKTGKES